jgi:anti-sigma factor RsiW
VSEQFPPDAADQLPDDVAELLSALVDGAVTDEERAEAAAWLDRSEEARREFEALGRVKAVLAGLPEVEPRPGFYDDLLQRPGGPAGVPARTRSWWRSPAALTASGLATAAAWIVLGGAGMSDRVVPPIDDVQVAAVTGAPLREVEADEAPVGEPVDVAAGSEIVTVLRQEGSVDWDELPQGRRSEAGDTEVWVAIAAGPATVVAERDGAVYTLVSVQVPVAGLLVLVERLPDGDDDSVLSRARNACQTLVETFTWD